VAKPPLREDAGGNAPSVTLPAFFELAAPKEWRAIDFISDLHLSTQLPRTFEAFAHHLRGTSADAVFILGDLFEVWVGDDMRERAFERRCTQILADAASLRSLAFMAGNRDFLLSGAMLRDSGMSGLPDPTVLSAWGQRVLLTHGDSLCLSDTAYQVFRREVRAERWRTDFLNRPLAERLAVGAEMRRRSQRRQRFDGDPNADIDPGTAVAWMHAMGTAEMIHGHTHRPGSQTLAPGFQRHVLSDWDLDGEAPRAEVLRLTRDGFRRLAPTAASH
jgi:UDP-2,3-diacylglucosamine hydrolase